VKIVGLVAENYKRLRIVEITPKGHVVQITGKNGQGKTSVIDAIWSALKGSKAIPEKPVRKGAEKAKIKLNLGEYNLTRTINTNGTHTLKLENAKGTLISSPQAVLDDMLGTLTFDPLAFITQTPEKQVETLRQVAKIELDIDALNAANAKDYDARTDLNRDIKRLEVEVAAVTVQDGLPKDKLDEASVLAKLNNASAENAEIQETFRLKQRFSLHASEAEKAVSQNKTKIENIKGQIVNIKKALKESEAQLQEAEIEQGRLITEKEKAEIAYKEAPEGTLIDVGELLKEQQHIQLVNREIDKRIRRQGIEEQLRAKKSETEKLTRAMEDRIEQKTTAIQNAAMPVEGLTFNENEVMFNGIPLTQLGEAEQIRISASIAMTANPKLRILRILHGESMDEDGLKILAEMAEANDFQIWMAKVDSSGKVGIVMEDGMVKAEE